MRCSSNLRTVSSDLTHNYRNTRHFHTITGTWNWAVCQLTQTLIGHHPSSSLVQRSSNVPLSPCASTAGSCLENSQWVWGCVEPLSTTPQMMGNIYYPIYWRSAVYFLWLYPGTTSWPKQTISPSDIVQSSYVSAESHRLFWSCVCGWKVS